MTEAARRILAALDKDGHPWESIELLLAFGIAPRDIEAWREVILAGLIEVSTIAKSDRLICRLTPAGQAVLNRGASRAMAS